MNDQIPTWINGELQPYDKLAAHLEGLKHQAVSVFLIHDGRILLQRRALQKYHTPGLWANTCCTHPHWGEAAEVCAVRRLAEELGIMGVALSHKGQVEYRADVGGGMVEHEVVEIFVAQLDAPPEMSPNLSEVMATEWVTSSDLLDRLSKSPNSFTPWLRIYMEQYAVLIFGGKLH
jgi:isopentenyl-diphosphate delta-isomerase